MKPICLFLGTSDDKAYLPHLKNTFNGCTTFVCTEPINLLSHLDIYCKSRNITAVVTTNTTLLAKLVELQSGPETKSPSLDNYAGSVFLHSNREILFINPLRQLFTVKYGAFIARRFISKIVAADTWTEPTGFSWNLITSVNAQEICDDLESAYAIAADIETFKSPLSIRCIGYTGVYISNTGVISTRSYVLPLDSGFAVAVMRRINSSNPAKIFQKGQYDNSYLLRYNAPCHNYLWDTANLMHSWYSELPKDLAFQNAFFLRRVVYWKDLADTRDLQEYYKYNALDTWATANVWIIQMLTMPAWARKNYLLEFPLMFPSLLAGMTGIKRDMDRLQVARKTVDSQEQEALSGLRRMIHVPAFNPGSPPQVKTLLKILGCGDIDSSNEKDINKAKLRHPINARILESVLTIRGLRKLRSTYLRTEDDAVQSGIHTGEKGAKEFKGRILYVIAPDGTDTGRNASREHAFWTGLQIQNIPVGEDDEPSWTKTTLCADDGFYFAEADFEKAESWGTGYISGDAALIAAVNSPKDFHSINASAFFGTPYTDIYDDTKKKTKNKPLRNLAKRTNHGANYNMGPAVLVDTMGVDKIWEAARLLGLPYRDPIKIAEHLLETFHRTYPGIKKNYYTSVINEVGLYQKITSRAFHHTAYNLSRYPTQADQLKYIEEGDWTRYCFGKPEKNKLDLNSYVAHCPQSLGARTLNEAFMRVFYEIALPNPTSFRLHAQIHDSILFSYREDSSHLAQEVKRCMEIPVAIRDVSGTLRTFTVPASLKMGSPGNPSKYWNETE